MSGGQHAAGESPNSRFNLVSAKGAGASSRKIHGRKKLLMMPSGSPPGSRTGQACNIFSVCNLKTRTIFSRFRGRGEFFSRVADRMRGW